MKGKFLFVLAILTAAMLAGAPAFAETLTINDTATLSATTSGFFTFGGVPITTVTPTTQETATTAGHIDFDGWYTGSGLAVGQVVTLNYNIYEPGSSLTPPSASNLSDTLTMTFTGTAPTSTGQNSHLVLTFFSSENPALLTAITGGANFNETGALQTFGAEPDFTALGAPFGTTISFVSTEAVIPLPPSVLLLGSGLLGLVGLRRFRKG